MAGIDSDNLEIIKGSDVLPIDNPEGATFLGYKTIEGVKTSIQIDFEDMTPLFGVTQEKGSNIELVPSQKAWTDDRNYTNGIHVSATLSGPASFGTIPVDFKIGDKVNIYLPPNVSNNRTYCTCRNSSNASVLAIELVDGDNINVMPADVASLYFYYGGTGYIEAYVYLLSGLNDLVINNNDSKLKNSTLLNSQSTLSPIDENMKYYEATQLSFKTDTVTTDTTKTHNGSIIKGKQFEFKTLAGSNPVIYGIDFKNGVRTQGTIITVLVLVYSPKLMKRIIPMILSGTGIKIVDTNFTHLIQGWNSVYFKLEYIADSDGGLEYIQYRTGLEANETSFLNTTMFFGTPIIFDYDAAYLDYNFVKLYEKLGKPILSTSDILPNVTLSGGDASTYDANSKTITKLHSSSAQQGYLRHNPAITLPSGDYVLMCKYNITGVEKGTIANIDVYLGGNTKIFTPFDGTYAIAHKYTGVINSSTFFGMGVVSAMKSSSTVQILGCTLIKASDYVSGMEYFIDTNSLFGAAKIASGNLMKPKMVVNCVGDSITQGQSDTLQPDGTLGDSQYPYYLQQLLGDKYTVNNLGAGGETIDTILSRVGAVGIKLPIDFVLSKTAYTGSDIANDTTNLLTSTYTGSPIKTLSQYRDSGQTYDTMTTAFLRGIECQLAKVSGIYKLARKTTVARDISIKAGEVLILNGQKYRDAEISILFAGQNGTYTDGTDLANKCSLFAKNIPNNKYLIIGIYNSLYYPNIFTLDIENAMNKEFGARFLNIQRLLCTEEALRMVGLTPTIPTDISSTRRDHGVISDEKCFEQGIFPSSFWRSSWTPSSESIDPLHMNAKGYEALAILIYNQLKTLRYV